MPPQMINCPQCGEANSVQKQMCYHCRSPLVAGDTKMASSSRPVRRNDGMRPRKQGAQQRARKTARATTADYVFGVSLRQRAQFYRQMYSLLNSGIPVGQSLSLAAENCAIAMKSRVRKLAEATMAGGQLAEAMAQFPIIFPEWEVSVVIAAEKAGTLPQVMREIADTLEMEWDLRTRTRSATFHLYITAIVFVMVLILLSSLQAKTTAAMANGNSGVDLFGTLGNVAYTTGVYLLLALSVVVGWRIFGRTRRGGRVLSRLLPRIPLLGPVLRGLMRIRFVRVLGTLWHAGVSPVEALEIAARTTGDRRLIDEITDSTRQISHGALLSGILASTGFLTPQALYLVQTGETTGDVSGALEKIAEYESIELDAHVKTLPIKLQLILYLIVGSGVLWLLIKFYTGYFQAIGL